MSGLDQVAGQAGGTLRRRAFELRPAGAPAMEAAKRARIEAMWPAMRERMRGQGLEVAEAPPRLGVDTRAAHVTQKIAAALLPERAAEHDAALYRAHWVEGRDLADPTLLAELATRLGLLADRFQAEVADPRHLEAVLADEEAARTRGIRGVPQVVMNGYLLPSGLLSPAALLEAAGEVSRRPPARW